MQEAILIILYFIIFAYSIILHEVFHGLMALWLGDPTAKYAGRLTANPLKHIDLVWTIIVPIVMILTLGIAFGGAKPVPYNPYNLKNQKWGPALVAFAGPLSNIVIATIFAILGKIISIPLAVKVDIINNMREANWTGLSIIMHGSIENIVFLICVMAIFWNILLAIFNLIPFPPLDGSKLLFAVLPLKMETMAILEQFGVIFLIAFVLLLGGPLSLLLNFFWQFFFGLTI